MSRVRLLSTPLSCLISGEQMPGAAVFQATTTRVGALVLALCASIAAGGTSSAQEPFAASAAPTIRLTPVLAWRVEQRFRLWDTGADTPDSRETLYSALAATEDADAVHDLVRTYLKGAPRLHRTLRWDEEGRAYAPAYVHPSSYAVRVGLSQAGALAGRSCRWQATSGIVDRVDVPCESSVRITVPASPGGGATIRVSVQADDNLRTNFDQEISVKDRLIASLGDSFASGEGNPDLPSDFSGLRSSGSMAAWKEEWSQRWLGRSVMDQVGRPSWADRTCHRSLYNQHLIAALKFSAARPHEAVTFLSYACSGASIFNGVLTAQPQAPGYRDDATFSQQTLSQVEALARDLCLPGAGGQASAIAGMARSYKQKIVHRFFWDPDGKTVTTPTFRCPGGARRVDAVLLSIGGNDVGFSPVIVGTLLPRKATDGFGAAVLQPLRFYAATEPDFASRTINDVLPSAIAALGGRLNELAPGAPVIQSAYPDPIRSDVGTYCGPYSEDDPASYKHPSVLRLSAVSGAWPDAAVPPERRWKLVIDQREGNWIEPVVVTALNNRISLEGGHQGWRFVDDYFLPMQRHGWCAGDNSAEQGVLPDWTPTAQAWSSWSPADWNPYARRARYFRTPNDAALTQFSRPARPLLGPLDGLLVNGDQVALVNSLAGAFHPTFQAHARMGLSVAAELQRALP